MSYMRVVRFTDVDPEHLGSRIEARSAESGPPEGVTAKAIKMMHDPDQRTAVVIQFFDSEQDMKDSEAALDSMDPSETPGTRASVDRGTLPLRAARRAAGRDLGGLRQGRRRLGRARRHRHDVRDRGS